MKKRVILSIVGLLTLGGFALADIQSPPGAKWNWSRKLSRSLANIAYGWSEYPITWQKVNHEDGSSAAASSFVVDGTKRTVVRLGYGIYEFLTFPVPTYKGTYRPPYYKHDRFDTWYGYQEFPPQVGFTSQSQHCRTQSW